MLQSDTVSGPMPTKDTSNAASARSSSDNLNRPLVKKPISFGKYLLLDRVNVGGMAEVYKAKAFGVEGFERMLAVKRILPSIAEDQEFITMFIDEAKLAVQLTHANIAQIFDLGKVNDSYFIAMEYVHGKDLRAIFDRARRKGETVPIPLASYAAMKICEGLDYAHNKKDAAGRELHLVHRDVSPQNVLLSYDGEVKLIDFGIAKAAGKAGKTQAGILKGKFGYMSPEQVRGLPLDRRSDVFALGIVLYELLTGERLFTGESDFSTLDKVRNVDIMPPSTYNRKIPPELEQIVLKSLAKDVDDRYQTAMDLHDDLQSFMYTSGNFFSRKDLNSFMKKTFAEEIAKETAKDDELRKLEAAGQLVPEAAVQASSLDAFADLPAEVSSPSIQPLELTPSVLIEHPEPSMLERPPTEAPTRRSFPPGQSQSMGAPALPPSSPAGAPARSAKSTMLGMAAPPMRRPSNPAGPSADASASGGPKLNMEWDEEELSTQIYDKPEISVTGAAAAMPSRPPQHMSAGYGAPGYGTSSYAAGAPSPFESTSPTEVGLRSVPAPSSMRPKDPTPPTSVLQGSYPVIAPQQSRTWIPFAVGFGLVAAAALIGYFIITRPATITLQTIPADSVVQLDGNAGSASSSPFVFTGVVPGTHAIQITRNGYQTWTNSVTVRGGQTLDLPAVTLLAAGTGASATRTAGTGFSLASTPPGAKVFVDGRELSGRTPITVSDLSAGAHQVSVQHEGYAPMQTTVVLRDGEVTELPTAQLMMREASVSINSTPSGAQVVVFRGTERRVLGRTPVSAQLDALGGPWTAELALDGYRSFVAPLQVNPADGSASLSATLESTGRINAPVAVASHNAGATPTIRPPRVRPNPPTDEAATPRGNGTLRVQSRPWSQVSVDGRSYGNTPAMNIQLPAGRHSLVLVNPDFNIRHTETVEIRAEQTTTRIVQLAPQ